MQRAGQSSDAWRALPLPHADQLREDFKQEADSLLSTIEMLQQDAVTRRKLESVIAREDFRDRLPLAASLILLPIALPLRITKVTAEIRIARQKESQAPS